MTQSDLARAVQCTQSAVSMFESGRRDALARPTVLAIAQVLGLDAEALPLEARRIGPGVALVLKRCPLDSCPRNVPQVIEGRLVYRPTLVEAPLDDQTICGECDEILESSCPNPDCGARLAPGSFCRVCGTPLVTVTHTPSGNLQAWADARRARIRELRAMTRPERYGFILNEETET